eukprot:1144609-Pelagomonas_calceolata.AAC.6
MPACLACCPLHTALVKMGASPGDEDEVVPVAQLDPNTQAVVPRLKAGAVQSWYSPHHPGWSIYYKVRRRTARGQMENTAPVLFLKCCTLQAIFVVCVHEHFEIAHVRAHTHTLTCTHACAPTHAVY